MGHEGTETVEVGGEVEVGRQLQLVKATNNDLLTRELHRVKWQHEAVEEVETAAGALGEEVTEAAVEEQDPQHQWVLPLLLDQILCQGTS